MTVVVGSMVGEGEATSTDSVTFTVDRNIYPGNPTISRCLVIVAASKDTYGPNFSHGMPVITDESVVGAPYYGMPNLLVGAGLAKCGASLATSEPMNAGPFIHILNGHIYVIRQTIPAESSITLQWPTLTFEWLGARAHVVTGLRTNAGAPSPLAFSNSYDDSFGLPSSGGTLYIPGSSAAPGDPSNVKEFISVGAVWTATSSQFIFHGGDLGDPTEQYGWTRPEGHMGYLFHDYGLTAPSVAMNVAYSGASPPRVMSFSMNKSVSGLGWDYPDPPPGEGTDLSQVKFRSFQ